MSVSRNGMLAYAPAPVASPGMPRSVASSSRRTTELPPFAYPVHFISI